MDVRIAKLEAAARRIRAKVVQMSHETGAAHLGSSLSCVDLMVVAYGALLNLKPGQTEDPNRDRFILSKGHASAVLFATLDEYGILPEGLLSTFARDGSCLAEQMGPRCAPGVEAATGSLGHGLPIGLGMAVAAHLQQRPYRVWVLLSDGECNEGSVWEAALFAAAQKLSNVVALVDYNGWQATGRSDDVLALAPLADKWRSFGWHAVEVDGHDIAGLLAVCSDIPADDKPTAIIARTVKGRGVSFMEDDNNWHYRIPNDEELQAARVELGQA